MDLISVNNFRRKKSLRYFALLFFFLMMCPCMVSAQNTVTIGGTVSSKGEPLIGAVVKEKGTTKATATNIDGVYSLTVQENAILEISYVGYKTKEIKVNGQKMIDIELEECYRSGERRCNCPTKYGEPVERFTRSYSRCEYRKE